MKRINIIQELRGLGVIFVILVHMSFIERKYSGGTDYFPDFIWFGSAGVDAFFVISGFMMVYINRNRPGGSRTSLSFAFDRLVRIYPTYWFYCLPLVPLYFLFPSLINISQANQVSIIKSLLLLPDQHLPLLSVAWTLIHEVYFYIVITILMFFPKKTRWWGIAVWALVCIGMIVYRIQYPSDSPLAILLANPINLEFAFGGLIAVILINEKKQWAEPILTVGCILLIVGYYFYVKFTGSWVIDTNWRVPLAGVPVTMIIYGLVVIENRNGFTVAKPLRILGDISYSTYLSHVLIISAIGKVWSVSGLQGPIYSLLWLSFAFIITLAWGFFSYKYVELPSWQFAKQINPFVDKPLK